MQESTKLETVLAKNLMGRRIRYTLTAVLLVSVVLMVALGTDLGLTVIRLLVNTMAAVGLTFVARRLYREMGSSTMTRHTISVFAGVAIYNLGAAVWFFLTRFGLVSPPPLFFAHVYTFFNAFETIPIIVFVQYLYKQT